MTRDRTARLRALATAVPPHVIVQDELPERAARLFPECGRATVERLLPVYTNSGIATRHSCVPPEWYERPHGWAEKNRLYVENAVALLARASSEAMERAGLAAGEIDAIVTVSTTGIATPSLDALLIERLGLRPDVERLPIFGLGCAGGVLGLARAASLAAAGPGRVVLLCVVELCGLTFRRTDATKSNVIATALFGDGAAAAIVSGCDAGDGPAIGRAGQHTWPGSLDIMGWTVEDDGLGVVFSRDIPALTRSSFRDAAAAFLAAGGRRFADIDGFVCHPGGAKVLDALEEAFGLCSRRTRRLAVGAARIRQHVGGDRPVRAPPGDGFGRARALVAVLARAGLHRGVPGDDGVTGAVYLVVGLVAAQRLAELVLARRNAARLVAAGGIEHGAGHYPILVALHAAWLAALVLAVPADRAPAAGPLAAYLALQPLRYWAVASLKGRWTTRVIVLPGAAPVRAGPYRYLAHPNYLVVALEIPLLPAAFGAWALAAGFGLANLVVLAWRIRVEGAALAGATAAAGPGDSAGLDRGMAGAARIAAAARGVGPCFVSSSRARPSRSACGSQSAPPPP